MVNFLPRVARAMAVAAGVSLIVVAIVVSLEVILRKVFMISLNVGSEMSSYVLAIVASWGAAFALFERAHVRIDALTRRFSRRGAAYADLVALLGMALFSLAMSWFAYGTFAESLRMKSRSMTPLAIPLWIPQGLWVLGLLAFSFSCLFLLARGIRLVLANRLDEAALLIGSPTAEKEALTELSQVTQLAEDNTK